MTDAISGPAHIPGPPTTSRLNGNPVGQFPQVSATSHGNKAGAPGDTPRRRITIALFRPANVRLPIVVPAAPWKLFPKS